MEKLTKKMYERCLNPDLIIWAREADDVKSILRESDKVEWYDDDGTWRFLDRIIGKRFVGNGVYRIQPDTPHEDEDYFELPVLQIKFTPSSFNEYRVCFNDMFIPFLYQCVHLVEFVGIVYDLNGVETLRTSIDAAFGVPKKVLFRQEDDKK